MIDQERLDRLLDRVASDLKSLHGYRVADGNLLDDPIRLAAVKYHFITAIEGCARIAHYLITSEGWWVVESAPTTEENQPSGGPDLRRIELANDSSPAHPPPFIPSSVRFGNSLFDRELSTKMTCEV